MIPSSGVPLFIFALLYYNRTALLHLLADEALKLHAHTSVARLAGRKSMSERRPSFVARSEQLIFLVSRVERFSPGCYWIGPAQLLLRLALTSMMAFITKQSLQCALASCIAIVGFVVHRELMPMRQPSE